MKYSITIMVAFSFFLFSCEKDWLEAKPDQSFVIIKQISEAQSLLDNTSLMNENETSLLDEGGVDYYYITESRYNTRSQHQKNFYTWASTDDFYAGTSAVDWENPYKRIFIANTVLASIDRVDKGAAIQAWNNVKGSALFFRAFNYFKLSMLFCKPYNATTAGTDKGLILKLTPEVGEIEMRASILQSYNQMIDDLKASCLLLPVVPSQNFLSRPSKLAAFALLSRIYLAMNEFELSKNYADSVLTVKPDLIDYNTLDPNATYPLSRYNKEVLFHATSLNNSLLPTPGNQSNLDSIFYQLFNSNDLRKSLWFTSTSSHLFKGSLSGSQFLFKGLTCSEVYLNKAECLARQGETGLAMTILNILLESRWRTNSFTPLTAQTKEEALAMILVERKKELCLRGVRWMDLRRLNEDNNTAITLQRVVGSQTFTLPPKDQRYTYPIPNSEILFNNVEQNPR